jgi:selenide, water dikinase
MGAHTHVCIYTHTNTLCLFLSLSVSQSPPLFCTHIHTRDTVAGFAITGHVKPQHLMTKAALRPGQVLLLTKPLGTGTLLAAAMRGAGKGRWVAACLRSMQESSAAAAAVLQRLGCRAATDVTGFGLAGHAAEMARSSGVSNAPSLQQ